MTCKNCGGPLSAGGRCFSCGEGFKADTEKAKKAHIPKIRFKKLKIEWLVVPLIICVFVVIYIIYPGFRQAALNRTVANNQTIQNVYQQLSVEYFSDVANFDKLGRNRELQAPYIVVDVNEGKLEYIASSEKDISEKNFEKIKTVVFAFHFTSDEADRYSLIGNNEKSYIWVYAEHVILYYYDLASGTYTTEGMSAALPDTTKKTVIPVTKTEIKNFILSNKIEE